MSRSASVSGPTSPKIAARVSCRYIGAKTRQTWEKREAWIVATARSSGSMLSVAFTVFWLLTVG